MGGMNTVIRAIKLRLSVIKFTNIAHQYDNRDLMAFLLPNSRAKMGQNLPRDIKDRLNGVTAITIPRSGKSTDYTILLVTWVSTSR